MPSLKMSLPGLFMNVARSIRVSDGRDQYAACLEEVKKHLDETIQGEHTLAEFAEHYCLTPPPNVQPGTLTVIYGDERVTLDPAKPWAEFQPARLRAEALIERAMQAHDRAHIDPDDFERASEVYGDRPG